MESFEFEPSEEDIAEAIKRLERQYPASTSTKPSNVRPLEKEKPKRIVEDSAEFGGSNVKPLEKEEKPKRIVEDSAEFGGSKPKPKTTTSTSTSPLSGNILNNAVQKYKDLLAKGVTYEGDIDKTDDYYNLGFDQVFADSGLNPYADIIGGEGGNVTGAFAGLLSGGLTPELYLSSVEGAPEYLSNLRGRVGEQSVIEAYATIADAGTTEELASALSSYYGYEISPVEVDLAANGFKNSYKKHTNSSAADMRAFQSLIRPILAEQVPYLMATEGLNYQKALEEAHTRDPMLQSLYFKYGVNPYRQTEDGSAYLYDPFSTGEIRTVNIKDKSVQNGLKAIALAGLGYITAGALAGPLSSLLSGSAATAAAGGTTLAGTVAAKAIVSGGIAALQGKDLSQILTAAATAGVSAGALELIPLPSQTTGMVTVGGQTLGDIMPDWLKITTKVAGLGVDPTSAEGMLSTAATLIGNGALSDVIGESGDVIESCFLLAQQVAQEEGVSSPTSNDLATFFDEAVEIYNDLQNDGYSHLRIMEELGYDPSEGFTQRVQESDLAKLQELRAGTDQTAYIDALGKSSASVGREHENAVIREKVAAGEDPTEASFLYQIAKDAVNASAETGDDKWLIGTAVALEAGAEIAQSFLGLATLVGYDPSNTEIAKTLDAISKMAGDSKPEDYQAGLKDISDRIQAAKDNLPKDADWQDSFFEVGKAIFGAAVDNPTEFLVDYVAKEFVQEIVPFAVGGAALAGAKLSSAALRKFGDDAAKKIADNMDASKIAMDATLLSDVAEAAGGSAGGAYTDAYDTFVRKRQEEYARVAEATGLPAQELSDADLQEAAEFATGVAQKSGAMGAVMALTASEVLGGRQLAESLFGPKVNKTAVSAMEEFASRVERTASGATREGLLEGLEEGAVQYVTDMSIREIDPDRKIAANVAESAILASVIGTNVGGGLTAGAEISDVVANVAKNTSAQVQKTIADAKAGLIDAAEAEAKLAEFGITSDGFGGVQTSLLNDAFDADYTTASEVKQAFETANPEFSASDKVIAEYVGNKPDAELGTQVAEYVDSRFVDAQEVMDAAAAEGLTLTEEQAQQYVKQTSIDADRVLEEIQGNFDEQYTTPEEARQLLIDAGYPEGLITGQTIEEVLGEVGEDGTLPESTVKQSATDFNAEYLLQLAEQAADTDDPAAPIDTDIDDVVDAGADDVVDTTPTETVDLSEITDAEADTDTTGTDLVLDDDDDVTDDADTVDDVDTADDSDTTAQEEVNLSDITDAEAGTDTTGTDLVLDDDDDIVDDVDIADTTDTADDFDTTAQEDVDLSDITDADTVTDTSGTDLVTADPVTSTTDLSQQYENVVLNDDGTYQWQGLTVSADRMKEIIAANPDQFPRIPDRIDLLTSNLSAVEGNLLEQIAANEEAGLGRDEALAKAIETVSDNLGITEDNLLDAISDSESALSDEISDLATDVATDLGNVEKNLLEEIANNEEAGLDRDKALAKAVETVADNLGTTEDNLLDAISDSESALSDEIDDLATDVATDLGNVEKNILEEVAANEEAGLDRDKALAEAIETVSDNLGITEDNLTKIIEAGDTALSDEIADVGTAVDDLAGELGVTKDELLDTIGQTEEDLLTALGETETALGGEIDTIAAVLGKPAQDVTSADVDFVTDLIAQQEALADPSTFAFTEAQLGYDVTGDGVVDVTDLNLLQDVLAGDQTLDPLADSRFAATGVFASQLQQQQELQQQLQQQQQQQMQQQMQMEQQAKQRAKESSARDFLSMLLASEEGRVDVGQSPLAQLEPAYDFGSIFGTPQNTASSPYGGYASSNPFGQPPRRIAQGGIIESNEELLRLLGKG